MAVASMGRMIVGMACRTTPFKSLTAELAEVAKEDVSKEDSERSAEFLTGLFCGVEDVRGVLIPREF